jgi:hypothetical protein
MHESLNKYRVFPRIALLWLIWVGTDAYLWAKSVIQPEDAQWFSNLVIGAVILGLTGYMNTGGKK